MTSNLSINFNTPSKSALLNKNILSSPNRKSFNSTINNNYNLNSSSYKNNNSKESVIQNSLLQKIIQNKISTQQQYQNLLISNKELQLKIINLQEKAQLLRKKYKKANKPLQEIKQKIQNGRLAVIQKQRYLQKFYVHLDSKLKSNMQSNLFNRLQKIQTALQQKYQQQREQLYQTLSIHHQRIQKQNQELEKIKQYRDQLIKQYTQKAFEISSHYGHSQKGQSAIKNSNNKNISSSKNSQQQKNSLKSQHLKNRQNQLKIKQKQNRQRKQDKLKYKKQAQEQVQFLKQNIKKLNKQKQTIQKQQKILKMILNIDQQHKKYSNYIINGFKKLFTIKYRQVLNKKKYIIQKNHQKLRNSNTFSNSLPPIPDVQKLQKQYALKSAQRKTLQEQVQIRNKGFQKCQLVYQQYLQEYSKLQQQLMELNNSITSKNHPSRISYNQHSYSNYKEEDYNPRSTYNPMMKKNY